MANIVLSAIEADLLIPGGTSDNSLLVIDVKPYREIRGFFAKRGGPQITLTLQILEPNSSDDKPSAANGSVIGVLDQFVLEGEFSRLYGAPGPWLQVLASIGPGGGARIGQLAFVGWD